jgi:hypothetical protein
LAVAGVEREQEEQGGGRQSDDDHEHGNFVEQPKANEAPTGAHQEINELPERERPKDFVLGLHVLGHFVLAHVRYTLRNNTAYGSSVAEFGVLGEGVEVWCGREVWVGRRMDGCFSWVYALSPTVPIIGNFVACGVDFELK